MIRGREYTFRGTLALVSGDNLASHYLGGYKSLSSALRKCRHCMAVTANMATEVILYCVIYTCSYQSHWCLWYHKYYHCIIIVNFTPNYVGILLLF